MNNLDDRVYAAEKLIRKRTRRGITEYYVKWRGWGPRHNTWEPESNILDARLIDVYEQNHCKADHSGRRGNKRKSHQIIRNEPIESDHDDSINGGGANSHDESEIEKTISENADAINDDEDDLNTGESKENGVDLKRKNENKSIVSDGESTSSEDALPLSKRKENSISLKRKENSIGMKRKAEVLSKESGKIGVTITTSPPNGTKHPKLSSPKDVKPSPIVSHIETTNKLYIRKSPATSPRGGGETPVQYQCVSKLSTSKAGDANTKGNLLMTCKTENTTAVSTVVKDDNKPSKESKSNTDKKKIENKEKSEGKMQISNNNDSNNNKDKKANIEEHNNKKDKINNENKSSGNNNNKIKLDNVNDKEQNKNKENNADSKKVIDTSKLNNIEGVGGGGAEKDKIINKENDDKNKKEETKSVIVRTVLKNPGHEYWRLRSPAADKIFITDVTVDLNTVTIRECKTDDGFFRQREEQGKGEENIENKDTEKLKLTR